MIIEQTVRPEGLQKSSPTQTSSSGKLFNGFFKVERTYHQARLIDARARRVFEMTARACEADAYPYQLPLEGRSGPWVQAEGRRRRPDEAATEGALLHFCLRVADVAASYARALAAGGVSRVAPRIAALGGEPPAEVHIAFITGPNGEVIEFLNSEQL